MERDHLRPALLLPPGTNHLLIDYPVAHISGYIQFQFTCMLTNFVPGLPAPELSPPLFTLDIAHVRKIPSLHNRSRSEMGQPGNETSGIFHQGGFCQIYVCHSILAHQLMALRARASPRGFHQTLLSGTSGNFWLCKCSGPQHLN